MIKVDINPVSFGYKHGVPVTKDHCRKCGIEVDVNIPVICKDFVGFESEPHECGDQYVISLLKPKIPLEGE